MSEHESHPNPAFGFFTALMIGVGFLMVDLWIGRTIKRSHRRPPGPGPDA